MQKSVGGDYDKENNWEHMKEAKMVEEPIKKITRKEMVITIQAI